MIALDWEDSDTSWLSLGSALVFYLGLGFE